MRSLRVQFMLFTAVLLVILLIMLNTFPITSSRDRIFEEKRRSLGSQATVMASSLANLDAPTRESISDVLSLLDISGFARTVVVDAGGEVLYDDGNSTDTTDERADIARALAGNTVFRSLFADDAFSSCFAMPMTNQGVTVGAVYIREHDAERAEMIKTMQGRIRMSSVIVACTALLIAALFSSVLLRRIHELVESMRIVASGDYGYRLATRGNDEITELGEEFNVLTERLETTERQRRRFVSDASHELKTPLASIRLLSDSIVQSENMNASTVREFVTDIGQEAERLQRTTEKLLELSRMDDDVRFDCEPVDVKQVAVDAMVLLRPLADERHVKMTGDLADGCVVMATVDDMFHIVFNLVENAIKYNVEGGSVLIKVASDDARITVTVEDTGIGIPEEDRFNIFSRFYRVDKARSREAGGSGLGLSIVHDAVQLYGGTIIVGANKPQGSRFTVSFSKPTSEETGI